MSEQSAHEARLEQLGAADSARERMLAGQERGRETVRQALALKSQLDSAEGLAASVRALAQAAVPGIVERWKQAANGKLKAWPASAQLKAGENLLALAGHSLDVAAGSDGSRKPLAEMGLGDLEGTLTSMLANIQTMRAIEGQAQRIDSPPDSLPQQGTTPAGELPPG